MIDTIVYAGRVKDKTVLLKSSSGGIVAQLRKKRCNFMKKVLAKNISEKRS